MNIRQKLTLNPETQAGQELLCLSRELLKIKSIEHANNWQSKFKIWKDKYYEFISQKVLILKLVKFDLHMEG